MSKPVLKPESTSWFCQPSLQPRKERNQSVSDTEDHHIQQFVEECRRSQSFPCTYFVTQKLATTRREWISNLCRLVVIGKSNNLFRQYHYKCEIRTLERIESVLCIPLYPQYNVNTFKSNRNVLNCLHLPFRFMFLHIAIERLWKKALNN